MNFGSAYAIIWADAHIGLKNACPEMKTQFQAGVVEVAAVPPSPPDPINDLICAVFEYSAPITFADTPKSTLELIVKNLELFKKIILISSATMGKEIVPEIIKNKFEIHSCYIFCANMEAHVDWVFQCRDDGLNMQVFDHQTTLLIRLGRDMSQILSDEGNVLLKANKPESALRYFEFALALADRAVIHDKPLKDSDSQPSTAYRPVLQRLIAEAKEAMTMK
jgi:hypothetical protein